MPREYAITIPAEPCSLKIVRAFMDAVLTGAEVDEADNIILALDEACANVVRHRCKSLDDGAVRVLSLIHI